MNITELIKSSNIEELNKVFKGAKVPYMRKLSADIIENGNITDKNLFDAIKMMSSSEEYEVRFFGTLLLGYICSKSDEYLSFLRQVLCRDENWRVKEATAKAFNSYCSIIGYDKCLPTIRNWMQDSNENVRRCVSEGLRDWHSKPFFKDNIQLVIDTLGLLRNDTSLYVKKSVANALSDVSKKYPDLLVMNFRKWKEESNDPNMLWIIARASRHLNHG